MPSKQRTEREKKMTLEEAAQEKKAETATAEKALGELIIDFDKGNIKQGLVSLKEELNHKMQWFDYSTSDMAALTPGLKGRSPISDLKFQILDYKPPSSSLLEEWRNATETLVKVWDVVKSSANAMRTVDLPPADEVELFDQNGRRIVVLPQRYAFPLDVNQLSVGQLTDVDAVKQSVEDVLVTLINWGNATELARQQDLEQEKKRLARQLEKQKDKGQEALAEVRRKADVRLENIQQRHKEAKQREQEMVKTFVVKVNDEMKNLLEDMMRNLNEKPVLQDVIQKLYDAFEVRLLGVDSGLRFLMDMPAEEWDELPSEQANIQEVLKDKLLPEQEEVTFAPVIPFEPEGDVELELGQPLPDYGGSAVSKFEPKLPYDSKSPWITCTIATQDDRLAMVDLNNKSVKLINPSKPSTNTSVDLDDYPWGLAMLDDGLMAVTSYYNKHLHLVDISERQPSVLKQVETGRQYRGVCAGLTEDTLVVCCHKDKEDPATVDVISREGDIIKTLVDSNTLSELSNPDFVCRIGDDVLFSSADKVFRVNVEDGQIVAKYTHPSMKDPQQIAVDSSGNLYIACPASNCVLPVSGKDGRFLRRLDGRQHGDGAHVSPSGVCVANSQLVVAWRTEKVNQGSTMIIIHELL